MATERLRSADPRPGPSGTGVARHRPPAFLTTDVRVMDVLSMVERVADSRAPVLILGESGTGKEIIARRLHSLSSRSRQPFIPLNCGAVPQGLLESELFGHEKGAFTGAAVMRRGAFEAAHRGTLFLDELAESTRAFQVALLRALQAGEVSRVGSSVAREVDVRVVSASNLPLDALIREGEFRLDLYYRLNVVRLELPPLRERPTDIPLLAAHFLEHWCRVHERHLNLSNDVLSVLSRHAFPGNVRELENIIQRAVLVARGAMIDVGDLPPEVRSGPVGTGASDAILSADIARLEGTYGPLKARLILEFDRAFVEARLRETAGNVAMAARRADLSERSFHVKMRQLGIQRSTFQPNGDAH